MPFIGEETIQRQSLLFGSTGLSDFHIKGTDYQRFYFIVDLRIRSPRLSCFERTEVQFNSCYSFQIRCTDASMLFNRSSVDILEIDVLLPPACGPVLPPRHHPNGVLKAAGPGR